MHNLIIQNIISKIGNKFDLILISSFRARQIQTILKDDYLKKLKKDKCTILALKEIQNNLINNNILDVFFNNKNNNFN